MAVIKGASNNRVNRSTRSEFLNVPSMPLARPVTRAVMPPQRYLLIDPTLCQVALALQLPCLSKATAYTVRRARQWPVGHSAAKWQGRHNNRI